MNYRLHPKPGIVKIGNQIKTNSRPKIISYNKTTVTKKNNNINKSFPVRKVIIKKPVKPIIDKSNRNLVRSKAMRSHPLSKKKQLELSRYKDDIIKLKNSGIGKILVMVACGPSILEVDLPKLVGIDNIDIMSINKPDNRIHPTKYWVFCDISQYTRNKELFNNYTGCLINSWAIKARRPNQILIRTISGKGFSKNLLEGYYIGHSTTYANMQTAYWMNYDKVYIFGCDMCQPPNHDKLHFYGLNHDIDPSIRVQRFATEASHYLHASSILSKEERDKFVFCSAYNKWPFVDQFRKLDHMDAVDIIIDHAHALRKNNM